MGRDLDEARRMLAKLPAPLFCGRGVEDVEDAVLIGSDHLFWCRVTGHPGYSAESKALALAASPALAADLLGRLAWLAKELDLMAGAYPAHTATGDALDRMLLVASGRADVPPGEAVKEGA